MKKKWDDLKQLKAYKLIQTVDEWLESLTNQITEAKQTLEQHKLTCKTMELVTNENFETEVIKLTHDDKVIGYIVKHPDFCNDPHKK